MTSGCSFNENNISSSKQPSATSKPTKETKFSHQIVSLPIVDGKEFYNTSMFLNETTGHCWPPQKSAKHHLVAKFSSNYTADIVPLKPSNVRTKSNCNHSNRSKITTMKSLARSNPITTFTTILRPIVLFVLLIAFHRPISGQYDQITITQDQPPVAQQHSVAPQPIQARQPHQELFVQPNSRVKIECKLPQVVANGSGKFYWNFQRSSHQDNKPDLLCFQAQCIDEAAHGIQLEIDPTSGAYDLLISNATYELNDGFYYCDYKDTSPDSRTTISRVFRLTVLIPPQPPTIAAATPTPAREGQEYQLNCASPGGNPEPNITWFRNEQPLMSGQGVRIEQSHRNGTTTSSLSWIPAIDDHLAAYKCSVHNRAMQGLMAFERELSLPVEFAPRISVGPHNPMRVLQGDKATLSCQVEANPPVKGIRWSLDGHLISNQFNHTLNDIKISDSGLYACQADNGIAPPLGLQAQQAQQQQQQQLQSSSSFFSFLGLAHGAAPAGQHPSDQALAAKTLVEARLQLEVLYPPRVQVRQSRPMPLVEGDYFSLNCSAEAWPPAHEFIWSKQEDSAGQRRISSSSSPLLEFNSIAASDMANYTCTAVNRLEASTSGQPAPLDGQGSASSLVLVKHKPGFAELLVGQNGETELGNKTQLLCRIKPPGFPEPQYKFWRYQSAPGASNPNNPSNNNRYHLNKQSADPSYTIFSAKADDEARYGCSAFNELGSSNEADGELIVNEAPKIISDSARRPEDARPQGDSPYSITVRATGKPEPRVAWFHRSPVDGRRVALGGEEMLSRFKIETVSKLEQPSRLRHSVVSTLTFKNALELDDRGLYTVEFSNGLSRSATEDFQLHIFHTPIPAPRNQPVLIRRDQRGNLAEPRLKAGFNLGEMARLTCRVSACPKPVFEWYSLAQGDKALGPNPRYQVELNNTQDDIWESTISFVVNSEADYGDYMCVSANQEPMSNTLSDSSRMFINLSRKSLPDQPSQLEQVAASQDSISLQWVPGFDGGFAQTQYTVQYMPLLLDEQPAASLAANLARRFAIQDDQQQQATLGADQQLDQSGGSYPKLYECFHMNPCTIGQLQPRQTYVVRVRARNELGFGEFSEEIRAHTRANISMVPGILEASFDRLRNQLSFRIEPTPEYLLANLNARVEIKSSALGNPSGAQWPSSADPSPAGQVNGLELALEAAGDSQWRHSTTVPIRQEQVEVLLNVPQAVEKLRITLCSRSNEHLCGPELVLSARSLASSFLQDQRGLSLSILMSTLVLIAALGAFATTAHSCCVSRKAKKAAALDRADGLNGHPTNRHHVSHPSVDDKPTMAGHTNAGLQLNGTANNLKGSHGSTTSTNNSSLTNGQLQSMDSLHHGLSGTGGAGSASDHSSDHSRQAKLDSMLPPNYNHYADRASLMLEQQQQQAAYMHCKLGSPFGLPAAGGPTNGAHQQQASPMGQFASYLGQQQQQLDQHHHQQQQANAMLLDETSADQGPLTGAGISLHSMLEAGQLTGAGPDGQQQPAGSMWPHHPSLDDYNNYNTLTSYQQQDQMIDPTYGTAAGAASLMLAQQQSAAYDNGPNQFGACQPVAYLGAPAGYGQPNESSSHYQQEIAAAQQQMYGTLTRNGFANNSNGLQSSSSNGSSEQQSINHSHQQQQQQGLMAEQQQQLNEQQQQQYMATNGLVGPPPPPVESDYGTARSGRLIREIIV